MNHYILLIGVFLCAVQPSYGQSTFVNEWFKQKSTQREYLIKQIAALKVYAGYLKKGYNIYKDGHNAISDFKGGEFRLHKDYFVSLNSISPQIANYIRIKDVLLLQIRIIGISKKTLHTIRSNKYIQEKEEEYISRVFERLLDDCIVLTAELADLTTAGKLELKDDERLQRIDILYGAMQDNYSFAEGFSKETFQLVKVREQEETDIYLVRKLFGQQH